MRPLSDAALERLREAAEWPELDGTRYTVAEPIARGGMGVVYRARDGELDRDVALKVLSAADLDEEAGARMLREARTLARLEHPGIVPVHDVGRLRDGRAFYVMKLVRGARLDEHARDGSPTWTRASRDEPPAPPDAVAEDAARAPDAVLLRTFERICEPVAFAHAHGVIHRDLKPGNVMVGAFGEVLVMDWGIAKWLSESVCGPQRTAAPGALPEGGQTAHGTVLGTPGYMAPEQARGDVERTDRRADVYSLGAILYFLLTGTAPAAHTGGATSGVSLVPPRRRNRRVAKPLEAICLKALASDPDQRYSSVRALAADVAAFQSGARVSAFPEGILDRIRRLARRHRTPLLLILAYLLMRLALLAFVGS